MGTRIRCALMALILVLAGVLGAHAQLRPEVTPKPKKPPAVRKPAARPPGKKPEVLPAPGAVKENPKDGLKYVLDSAGDVSDGLLAGGQRV